MAQNENLNISNIANLEFLVNFDQGITHDEIDYVMFWVMFTIKNTAHYNREFGGSFQNIEQGKDRELEQLVFATDTVLSVYLLNQARNFNPYLVVGHTDISIESDKTGEEFNAVVKYRLLQDLSINDKTTTKVLQNGNI